MTINAVTQAPRLGLKANWRQFTLLVIINAFVGGMVGLERSILPEIARQDFQLEARTAIFSFIIVFGFVKALSNYLAGALATRLGRKHLLILGWLIGLPVPFLLMLARDWSLVVFANVLLGINQGLTWSTTVMMKIDLVGPKNRGLAMGLNEFAGYLSVAFLAFITGWVAAEYGLRPYPFLVGVVLAALGLWFSMAFVRDTTPHVQFEARQSPQRAFKNLFFQTSFLHPNLSSITQAGLINNLNDGMMWGSFPLLLASKGFSLKTIGVLTAVYPAFWGAGQLVTGKLSDRLGRKPLLFWGMLLQGFTLIGLVFGNTFWQYFLLASLLGIGTAMVYPTFLAAIADNTHPQQRAHSIGVFRLWRDSGYAFGAILTGLLADAFTLIIPIMAIGVLSALSGMIIGIRMREHNSQMDDHRNRIMGNG